MATGSARPSGALSRRRSPRCGRQRPAMMPGGSGKASRRFPESFLDPILELLIPEDGVLRLADPVAFVRKENHFRGHVLHLQTRVQLHALAHWNAVIQFAMNDERGSLEALDEAAR